MPFANSDGSEQQLRLVVTTEQPTVQMAELCGKLEKVALRLEALVGVVEKNTRELRGLREDIKGVKSVGKNGIAKVEL